MSTIEKLAIRGIRAFSPDREQAIEFESPLTMIVGANGCGKTTVIECLKYGTTGEGPPGSGKGKSFVHDPKVSGITEVKAQLKLRFKNYGGQRMVVVRSMQLTQKKATQTFKQMDGVIRATKPNGERTSYTHKCGELDKTVPMMIGVSKAVLESVVFCHQEDSSWPLQEGAVLKKRFDDIFESARYTKALDVLQKQKKALAATAKELAGDLKGLHADKTAAANLRRGAEDARTFAAKEDEALKSCDETRDALKTEQRQTSDRLRDLQQREADVADKRAALDALERNVEFLAEQIEDSGLADVSDAQLEDTSRRLQEEDDSHAAVVRELEAKVKAHQAEARQRRAAASALDGRTGEAEAEKKRGADEVRDLRDALSDARHDLDAASAARARLDRAFGDEGPIAFDVAEAVREALDAKGEAAHEAEKATDAEADAALQAANAAVAKERTAADAAKAELDALEPRRRAADKAQRDVDDALKPLRRATDEAVAAAQAKLEKQRRDLEKFRGEHGASAHAEAIRSCEADERRLADELDAARREQRLLEVSEDEERELSVLDHAAARAAEAFDQDYASKSEELREAAEDYEQADGGGGQVVEAPPPVDRGGDEAARDAAPAFCDRVKGLVKAAATRAADAKADAAKRDASARAEARGAAAEEARASAALRAATDALERLPGDARQRLGQLRSRARDLQADEARAREAAQDSADCAEDLEAAQKKNDDDASANGWLDATVVTSGDDAQALANLVTAPRNRDEPDARRATATWARAFGEAIGARQIGVTAMPTVMKLLKGKLETTKNGRHVCPLCRRDWDASNPDSSYQKTLERVQRACDAAHKDRYDGLKREAASLSEDLDALEPQWRAWADGVAQKVKCERDVADAKAAAQSAAQEAEAAAKALDEATQYDDAAANYARSAEDLANLGSEFRDAAAARDAKKAELDRVAEDAGVGGRRTQREVQDQIRRLQEAKEAAVNARAKAEKDKAEALRTENQYISSLGACREAHTKLQTDLEKKKRLEADRAAAQKTTKDVEARKKELVGGDRARQQALERAQAARDDASAEWTGKRKKARAATNAAKASAGSVSAALRQAERGAKRVADAEATLADLATQRRAAAKAVSEAERAAGAAYAEVQAKNQSDEGRELQKKDVDANLAHRRKARERDAAREALAGAEADARSGGGDDEDHPLADKSPSDLNRRLGRIQKELESLAGERGVHEGKRDRARTEARTHQGELQTARYRGIDERHRTAMIERETTEMACKDVEHYWTALDRALGSFHRMKIEEINRIIKELWQITYMGEDIDAIEIVSGEDAGSKRAARSYNYHVQMRKAGAALDMKGRCSAGQRVLASIVIRLALAQTFCIKCGILALDEPTTNLDEANRRSLAHGLSRIIADRAKQTNFQLVVITHDEEFIGTLRTEMAAQAGASMPEHYWRISREDLGGRHFSRIDKIPMDQLQ